MTDAQRRFADARDEVVARFHRPLAKLLDAAQSAVVEANQRAKRAETRLDVLRGAMPPSPELNEALRELYTRGWQDAKSGSGSRRDAAVEAAIAKARGQTD